MLKLIARTQLFVQDRIEGARGAERDRGEGALTWVIIAAAALLIAAAVYAALDGKAAEKIGIINNA